MARQYHLKRRNVTCLVVLTFLFSFFFSFKPTHLGAVEYREEGTLLGVDKDNNFIRDDIDVFLGQEFSSEPSLLKAFKNYTQKITKSLLADDGKTINRLHVEASDVALCLSVYHKGQTDRFLKMFNQINRMVVNNKIRYEKLTKNNKLLKSGKLNQDTSSIRSLCN